MRINSSGNVCIGTTDDGGYKLRVNGSVRLEGFIYPFLGIKPAWAYSSNGSIYRSTIWYYLSQFLPNVGDVRICCGGGLIDAASSSSGSRKLLNFSHVYRYSSSEIRIYGVDSQTDNPYYYAIVTNDASTRLIESGKGISLAI